MANELSGGHGGPPLRLRNLRDIPLVPPFLSIR